MLPLMELYLRGNPAGRDFFRRMYDDFHPIGIADDVTITSDYDDADGSDTFVIDDFQTNPALGLSSSGGAGDAKYRHSEISVVSSAGKLSQYVSFFSSFAAFTEWAR